MNEYGDIRQTATVHWRRGNSAMLSISLAAFIGGVCITHLVDLVWKNGTTLLLVAAALVSLLNTLWQWRRLQKSKAEYEASLERLKETDPQLAALIESNYQ